MKIYIAVIAFRKDNWSRLLMFAIPLIFNAGSLGQAEQA